MLFLNHSSHFSHSLLYINTASQLHSSLLWEKNTLLPLQHHMTSTPHLRLKYLQQLDRETPTVWSKKQSQENSRFRRKLNSGFSESFQVFFFMHCILNLISVDVYSTAGSAYRQLINSQFLSCWVLWLIRPSYMQIFAAFL